MNTGRMFYTISDIKRTIDRLSMSKMNVLHLHITEMQSVLAARDVLVARKRARLANG